MSAWKMQFLTFTVLAKMGQFHYFRNDMAHIVPVLPRLGGPPPEDVVRLRASQAPSGIG
jgi:hypothetical protein